jgi:DNA-binding NarL/FixJ family response regulator
MRRIFIVEDHEVLCESYLALIEEEAELTVCGMAGTAAAALAQIPTLQPDLLLLDLSLPDLNGFALLEQLRAAGWYGPALIVSGHPRRQYEHLALQSGAAGYVDKMETHVKLIPSIHAVLGATNRAD